MHSLCLSRCLILPPKVIIPLPLAPSLRLSVPKHAWAGQVRDRTDPFKKKDVYPLGPPVKLKSFVVRFGGEGGKDL